MKFVMFKFDMPLSIDVRYKHVVSSCNPKKVHKWRRIAK